MKKLSFSFVFLLCALSVFAWNDDIKWKRDLMDGSRTGCTVPVGVDDSKTYLGEVKGKFYYAPNGKVFKGNIADVAGLVINAQPAMAPVKMPLGRSEKEMIKAYPECALSNFFIDTIIKETERVSGRKVDIGIGNFGGIRVDMPKGTLIVDDIMSMFPFRNDIVYLTAKGSDVRAVLEDMAAHGFQVLGGVKVVADKGKLVSVEVGGEPLCDDRIYGVATISFLLDGGDNLSLRKIAIDLESCPVTIYEVISGYIKREADAGKAINAESDHRVQILDYKKAEKSRIDYGVLTDSPVDSRRKLTILHTNDTHSHIDPVRGGTQDGYAGVIERAAYIDSVRNAAGKRNMLLLDAGDFSQGTSYFTILNGDLEVSLMNVLGYDVSALGNHEFDNGLEELARRLKMAEFDVVCANYDFSGSPLEGIVKPYTIVRKGGNKIGVFGLLTDVTKVVDREIADKMKFLDPVETANKYASILKDEEKCDIVICLSHLGFDGAIDSDCKVAGLSEDIDIIVGGHSHTELENMVVRKNRDGEDVIVLQDGSWGVHVGNLQIL